MDQIKKTIEEHQDKIEKFPELAAAIERLMQDHEKLKKSQAEKRRLKDMMAHEIRSPLSTILGYSSLLKMGKMSREETPKAYDALYRASTQISELLELLNLSELSKYGIRENSKKINLEEIAREHGKLNDDFMKEEKIGLCLRYNRIALEKPIEIYANAGVINAVWGTLYGNCLCWATQNSIIKQGIRITKSEKLEISMENNTTGKKQRNSHGMGRGRGFPFVLEIIENLGGELSTYRTAQNQEYEFEERFGYQNETKIEKPDKIFGIQIKIPMNELIE